MNVRDLVPRPSQSEPFRPSHTKFVSERSGCYVLCSAVGKVLYIGLAENIQRRMGQHLEDPTKTQETTVGRAALFYWLEAEGINALERAWMNVHIQHEGVLPVLNRVYSPVG